LQVCIDHRGFPSDNFAPWDQTKQLNMNALVEQDRTLLKFRAREQ